MGHISPFWTHSSQTIQYHCVSVQPVSIDSSFVLSIDSLSDSGNNLDNSLVSAFPSFVFLSNSSLFSIVIYNGILLINSSLKVNDMLPLEFLFKKPIDFKCFNGKSYSGLSLW